jgi:GntR family transcriptional repressor for pyruvate dehydrogenase complex
VPAARSPEARGQVPPGRAPAPAAPSLAAAGPGAGERAAVPDQVFLRLSEDIVAGRYAPGEKLPTQRRLAADLGASMASVREAVKRLEQLRLVEVRHGDAMRVLDWRARGGLDVMAHLLFRPGGFEPGVLAALMEARRSMLVEIARLAAERRSDDHAERLSELAARIGEATDGAAAQAIDFEFFALMADAAANLVFTLVMNSIREVYFGRADLFAPMLAGHADLAPLYRRAAKAVNAGAAEQAGRAVELLARAQEERLMGAASRW